MKICEFVESAPAQLPQDFYRNKARGYLSELARLTQAYDKESRAFWNSLSFKEKLDIVLVGSLFEEDQGMRAELDEAIALLVGQASDPSLYKRLNTSPGTLQETAEEKEVLYYNSSDRYSDYLATTEGVEAKRYVASLRNTVNAEYDAGSKLPYLTLAPEDNMTTTDTVLYRIPYIRQNNKPVQFPTWVKNGEEFQIRYYNALSIYASFKNYKGEWIRVPLYQLITKYFNLVLNRNQELQHLYETKNWAKRQMLMNNNEEANRNSELRKFFLQLHYSFAQDCAHGMDIKLRGKVSDNNLEGYREINHPLLSNPITLYASLIPLEES